jgi:GGDEF domain-containing protein
MLDLNYPVSLSIGAVTFHQSPLSVSDVLHQADVAMYQRKMEIKSRSNSPQA